MTAAYENDDQENAERTELPGLRESGRDTAEANKENSRRVRCYIPGDLANQWEKRHRSARSASELLQEALRTELERTTFQVCQGCGGTSEYNGGYWADADLGAASEVLYEVYTCTTCKKSQRDGVQVSRASGVFQPSALEKHELWRYDNGIIWVGEDEREPSPYDLALKGFLTWIEYRRSLEENAYPDDPGFEKYIAAQTGKRLWDAGMAEIVDAEIEAIRRENDEANGSEAAPPWDPDDDDTLPF